ncbi:hypothetical protein H2198_010968, partial [Neophaeococcomyces mojaviensis]
TNGAEQTAKHLTSILNVDACQSSALDLARTSSFSPATLKRKAKSLDYLSPRKRSRLLSEPAGGPSPIDTWLSTLPASDGFEPIGKCEVLDNMSQPPTKRSRSSDSLGRRSSQSGDGSDTAVSRDKKYSVYKDGNYPVVLETKGSFMRPSEAGLIAEDREFCDKLLTATQPLPDDVLFDDDHFPRLHLNLRGRSEARLCVDLHPRVVPSVENLYIGGRHEFEGLIEGHNDSWVKSVPFYGPRPQPDHTFGFKWSNFTEEQRRKLNIEPTEKSYYTAREDIYFPFLTCEVKCGKQGLDLADRPNTHSMTIIQRGVVDVYRRANRAKDVHRRVLGFSVSHDDNGVRMYAHYPEIDGDKTTYWRETLKDFSLGNDKGKDRWACYHFTLNVCQLFALPFLQQLKVVIDQLPDPIMQQAELASTLDEISVQSSQDDASAPELQDDGFKKPRSGRGLNAELKTLIQSLQRQLEQQRKESKERERLLLSQLEQQRKEAEQQRKEADEQQKELVKMLKQQSDQMKQLLDKR